MFRKVRRVNLRKRNDSEEEEREREEDSQPAAEAGGLPALYQSYPMGMGPTLGAWMMLSGSEPGYTSFGPPSGLVIPQPGNNGLPQAPAKPKVRKKPRDESSAPKRVLLSFKDEVEEEEEEVFQVKKSNYSKKIVKLLKKEYKEDLEKSKGKTINSTTEATEASDKLGLIRDPNLEDGTGNSELGEEEMEVESDKEEEKPKAGAFSSAVSNLNVLRPGEIPDAAFIHAARKKRQLARELGDFPSVENDTGKSRLVREDENDASDDEDDDEKRRIVFSVKEKSQRQKIAEEIGIEGSDDEALASGEPDEELSRWEQEQIRKGISIPQVQPSNPVDVNNLYYQNAYQTMPYGSTYDMPYTYAAYGSSEMKPQTDKPAPFKTPINEMTPVSIDLVKKQLKDRLSSMEEVHKTNLQQQEKHLESTENSTSAIEKLEGSSGGIAERYKFLQEMRGYVQDLLECFNEKVPLINELESSMHQLCKQRAARLVQRRQDDIKDESAEFSSHSNKALMAPNLDSFGRDRTLFQEHAKQRRVAEREARRTRRRQAREISGKMAEHLEGLSTDDEETSTDTNHFNSENERILKESNKVFEDVLENFHSIDYIRSQFETWRSLYYTSYKEAYIGLCLPKLLNPLIRLQLLTWTPLEVSRSKQNVVSNMSSNFAAGDHLRQYLRRHLNVHHEQARCCDFEKMVWFESLLFYGCEESEQDKSDVDIALLPTLVEKLILPKLADLAENIWDPFSSQQTSRLVAVVQRFINGYPSVVNADNKNTQVLLKALLMRMRRTLDDDVFMPLYPKNVLENKNSAPCLFFQRQFWSSVKLLGNFLQWHGILSNRALQELAIDGLLNRYILLAFQNLENGEDSIKKAQCVIECFPRQWFSCLKGETTIPQLENFCRYLVHLAGVVYRGCIGCSDVEKRNARDQIKQIIKLLAIINALNHALDLAADYNIKEFKAPE